MIKSFLDLSHRNIKRRGNGSFPRGGGLPIGKKLQVHQYRLVRTIKSK